MKFYDEFASVCFIFIPYTCIKYYIINTYLHLSLPFLFISPLNFPYILYKRKYIDLKTVPYYFWESQHKSLRSESNEFSKGKKCKMLIIHSNSTGSKIIWEYDLVHQTIQKLHHLSKQQNAMRTPSCFPGQLEESSEAIAYIC